MPDDTRVLVTVLLHHYQTKTLDEIMAHLRKTGFYRDFPPERHGERTSGERKRSDPEAQERLYRRFDAKVELTPSCWEWTGATTSTGYGNIGVAGKTC